MRPDARPQARKNRRHIHWNTLRIFSSRARCRWPWIVCHSRTVTVGQAPRRSSPLHPSRAGSHAEAGRSARFTKNCSERCKRNAEELLQQPAYGVFLPAVGGGAGESFCAGIISGTVDVAAGCDSSDFLTSRIFVRIVASLVNGEFGKVLMSS